MFKIIKVTALFVFLPFVPLFSAPVDYPGSAPGSPRVTGDQKKTITLANDLISATWGLQGKSLALNGITDHKNNRTYPQPGSRIKISCEQGVANAGRGGVYLACRLEGNSVDTLVSTDGRNWKVVRAFPHTDFPGKPSSVMLGYFNNKHGIIPKDGKVESNNATFANFNVKGAFDKSIITDTLVYDNETETGAWKTVAAATATQSGIQFNRKGIRFNAKDAKPFYFERTVPQSATFFSVFIDKFKGKANESDSAGICIKWDDGKSLSIHYVVPFGSKRRLFVVSGKTAKRMDIATGHYPTFDAQASDFVRISPVRVEETPAVNASVVLAARETGKQLSCLLRHKTQPLTVLWKAVLRQNSTYIRQTYTLTSDSSVGVHAIELLDLNVNGPKQIGTVAGSPVIVDNLFFGLETPMFVSQIEDDHLRSGFSCNLIVDKENTHTYSSVIGIYPAGQLRRGFLYYLEREKAHYTRPFPHYCNWYDLAWHVTEANMLEAIKIYRRELHEKRGVELKSYCLDGGWFKCQEGLWVVNKEKFPNDFTPLVKELTDMKSNLGLWLSPLGGYAHYHHHRKHALAMGLIKDEIDLAEPKFYKWLRDKLKDNVEKYKLNYYKWDRAGLGPSTHFLELCRLAHDVRQSNPDIYLNATVGTWVSPFWLNHVDSIWRGGADMAFRGDGNNHQKWITFRDAAVRKKIIQNGPLFPMNAMMLHGISHGRLYQGKRIGDDGPKDLKDQIRSFFAFGTSCQEIYITPQMIEQENWDQLAESIKWNRANSDVLVDTHFIGGDPFENETYGYASWNTRKGVLGLRNPAAKPQKITIRLDKAFELPLKAIRSYHLKNAYSDQTFKEIRVSAEHEIIIALKPFEVLILEAIPTAP